jgi:hypothetical protein
MQCELLGRVDGDQQDDGAPVQSETDLHEGALAAGVGAPRRRDDLFPRFMSPPHAISGSQRPPRSNPPLPTKTRRQAFIVQTPRLMEGAPLPGQDDGVRPRQLPNEVVAPGGNLRRRLALLPCDCVEDLGADLAHFPSRGWAATRVGRAAAPGSTGRDWRHGVELTAAGA